MRRRLFLTVPAAAGALALTGCADDADSADTGKLTVWVMGDSSANFEELVKPFAASSGLTIDVVAIPWDSVDQKLTTAVASGKGPDVVQIGVSKLRTFADSGALLTLDDATLGDYPNLAEDNFLSGAAGEAMAVDGTVVSVPWIADTRVLFYRSDLLSASGISQPPSTWDEVRADAKVLAGRGGGSYGYYIPQWDSALPVIMTWTEGGQIVDADSEIDFDTDAFRAAVDTYTGLYADGSVPTDSDFDQVQGFVSGATPMLVSGPYLAASITAAAPELAGAWSVTDIPGAASHTSLLAGSHLGIWGSTANRDGALDLLDYLCTPETQLSWYQLDAQLPAVTAALTDSTLTADPLVAVYSRQLTDARALPLVPNWDGETGKALLDSLNSIVLTGADRDDTLSDLYQATKDTRAN